jgi:hypothetical protein
VQKTDETVVAKTGVDSVEKTGANTTQPVATETEPSKTDDPPATKPEETTKPDGAAKPDEKKSSEETKKEDSKTEPSNGSVSLNFSPKKTTEGETSGAATGQTDPTGTASAADADSGQAAA